VKVKAELCGEQEAEPPRQCVPRQSLGTRKKMLKALALEGRLTKWSLFADFSLVDVSMLKFWRIPTQLEKGRPILAPPCVLRLNCYR
jgi:hypothetical protein